MPITDNLDSCKFDCREYCDDIPKEEVDRLLAIEQAKKSSLKAAKIISQPHAKDAMYLLYKRLTKDTEGDSGIKYDECGEGEHIARERLANNILKIGKFLEFVNRLEDNSTVDSSKLCCCCSYRCLSREKFAKLWGEFEAISSQDEVKAHQGKDEQSYESV